jgi:hypothetical protein
MPLPIEKLIDGRLSELDLRWPELIARLGYKNISRGLPSLGLRGPRQEKIGVHDLAGPVQAAGRHGTGDELPALRLPRRIAEARRAVYVKISNLAVTQSWANFKKTWQTVAFAGS